MQGIFAGGYWRIRVILGIFQVGILVLRLVPSILGTGSTGLETGMTRDTGTTCVNFNMSYATYQ